MDSVSGFKSARSSFQKDSPTRKDDDEVRIPGNVRLMYLANEGDVDGIRELIKEAEESGGAIDVNYADVHGRTALHVAACQGYVVTVKFLVENGALLGPIDRMGNTPLDNAIHYRKLDVIELFEKYGAKAPMPTMQVKNIYQVPEYEICRSELDFTNSSIITKGTFRIATWRGIQVAVKTLGDEVFANEEKVMAFRDELTLFQKMRHPNVVQFLGAVTQSSPMMIITEYLPMGDLGNFLKTNGPIKPSMVVRFALDIARGMNYLHKHKPEAIIHRDLEPSNILLDDSRHLKVADFDGSRSLLMTKSSKTMREDTPPMFEDASCRYVAPEVFKNAEYDTKADVFSFALILQVMIERCSPFSEKHSYEVPRCYAEGQRPPFRASRSLYTCGLRRIMVLNARFVLCARSQHTAFRLIEDCWHEVPSKRPTFELIIERLLLIQRRIVSSEVLPSNCFQCLLDFWLSDDGSDSSSRNSSR